MSVRTVVTRGYGNGTFNGTIPFVVTRGYSIAIIVSVIEFTLNSRSVSFTLNARSTAMTLIQRVIDFTVGTRD